MTMNRANAIAEIINNETNLEATATEVRKGDFIEVGITIGEPDARIKPNIYPSQFEDLSDDDIVDKILEIYEANKDNLKFDINDYTDFNRVKGNLFICVRPTTSNPDDVKRPYLDIEEYIRYMGKPGMSIIVKKSHAELWDVTEDMLFDIAKANGDYTIDGMAETLRELSGEDIIDDEVFEVNPMYVVTTKDKMYGASAITANNFMLKFSKKIGSSFYIIPSSIHELIILPEQFVENKDDVKNMIREVNDTQVLPDEILSYNLYYFNGFEVILA